MVATDEIGTLFPGRHRSFFVILLLGATVFAGHARAADRVSVRGVYFREDSTRVIEPMVEVSKDLPQGLDVSAHYILDAVTSASVASGAGVRSGGGDAIFTEVRHQVGGGVGFRFAGADRIDPFLGATRVGVQGRHSGEPDYVSWSVGLSIAQDLWQNTGSVSLNLARSFDVIKAKVRMINDELDTWFVGVAYSQALSPVLLVQAGYEFSRLDGYQANPYLNTPGLDRPRVPRLRLRHVLFGRVAYYLAPMVGGFQLHYRAYLDGGGENPLAPPEDQKPWGLSGHTVEARLYKTLSRDFEARLSYRFHTQGSARFWCNTDPMQGGTPSCYDPATTFYHTADPKLGDLGTHIPEVKISWNLRVFASVPVLSVFAAGTAEISYGYLMQSTRYGNAHLLQAGYTLPF